MTIEIDSLGAWLGVIAGIITSVSIIVVTIWKLLLQPKIRQEINSTTNCSVMADEIKNKVNKDEIKKVYQKIDEVNDKVDDVMESHEKLKVSVEHSNETDTYLLYGIFACLDALKQQGANGIVTQRYNDIQDYLIRRGEMSGKE